MLIDKIVH